MGPLKFHWRLLQGGETGGDSRSGAMRRASTGLPDLSSQRAFCRRAEELGIQGLLVDIGAAKPDPIVLSTALGLSTDRIELIIACRSGLIPPTTLVQQINTLSALIDGRLSLNVVAGHSPAEQRFYGDHLSHDERYTRTEEYLAVCRALWADEGPVTFKGRYFDIVEARLNTPYVAPGRRFPEIFVAGGSDPAKRVATSQGTLWMRLADRPETLAAEIAPVLAAGKEVGLRLAVICRPNREAALSAAGDLVAERDSGRPNDLRDERRFVAQTDSVSIKTVYDLAEDEWLTPMLWTGAVRSHGAPAMSIVGTPDEVAQAFIEYGQVGVTQFILSGWPKLQEMEIFGEEVLPLIRQREAELARGPKAEATT
jgi:alkanesulfonate monooxygenase